jgi:hypothetical protein
MISSVFSDTPGTSAASSTVVMIFTHLSVGRGLLHLRRRQALSLLHIPFLKRANGRQQRRNECGMFPRGSKSDGGTPTSGTCEEGCADILQVANDECRRQPAARFEREVSISECGTGLGGTFVGGSGVGIGKCEGGDEGGILGDDSESGGEGGYR